MYSNYITNYSREEFESVLRREGFKIVKPWRNVGTGDQGDRKFQCEVTPRAYAHYYDGSSTGYPCGDTQPMSPKARKINWPKDYGGYGQRANFTPPAPITPEEIAKNEAQERKLRERNAAQLCADIEAYNHETTRPADDPNATGARYLIGKGVPLDISPYLKIATRPAEGSPTIPAGALVVPFFDVRTPPDKLFTPEYEIIGFQWIVEKSFAKQHGMATDKPYRKNWTNDGMNPRPLMDYNILWIGDPRGAGLVALAEGLATAATFYRLTGIPTGSTCSALRLERTATAFLKAEAWKQTRLIIAADDDEITGMTANNSGQFLKNKGRSYALKLQNLAPARVFLAPPPWPWAQIDLKKYALHIGDDINKFSDWNDYAELRGIEAAREGAAQRLKEALEYFRSYERTEPRQ